MAGVLHDPNVLPDDLPASFGITGRYARQTNYISPPGNFVADRVDVVLKLGRALRAIDADERFVPFRSAPKL